MQNLSAPLVALAALVVMLLAMLAELILSRANERRLKQRGAVEPPDAAYGVMPWVYPSTFVAMAIEGALTGPGLGTATAIGLAVLVMAKVLKYWAIATLGPRWTYRILVLPGEPLVTSGPYALMRHPNYVGVAGELIGMAILVGARVTGPICVLAFGYLLRLRIADEERAHRHARRG